MGRYSSVGTVACPTLLKPTRHSPGPDTCHLKRSYLLGVGGSSGTLGLNYYYRLLCQQTDSTHPSLRLNQGS